MARAFWGFVKKALEDHGFSVRVLRRNAVNDDEVSGDVSHIHACNWERYLKDVHAVVNLSGIMRETGINTFEGVHVKGPSNLLNVCRAKNIRFVQVSALGSPDDGPFVASKHAFDDILLTTYAENSVIFRPSVVCSPKGAYGGTELLRALSAFPLFLPLPDRGQFLFQPIDADDLGLILARACLSDKTGVYELGQKDPITLKEYLLAWRKWMGLPSKMMLRVPQFLISLSVFLSEYFLKGPLTRVVWAMLRRGNTVRDGEHERVSRDFGVGIRDIRDTLKKGYASEQERTMSQLYFLRPAIFWSVFALFLLSGILGLGMTEQNLHALSPRFLSDTMFSLLNTACSSLDILASLCLLLFKRWRKQVYFGMFLMTLFYLFLVPILVPDALFDPYGGLLKNICLLPLLALASVLEPLGRDK